jgi:hypothetical protein
MAQETIDVTTRNLHKEHSQASKASKAEAKNVIRGVNRMSASFFFSFFFFFFSWASFCFVSFFLIR